MVWLCANKEDIVPGHLCRRTLAITCLCIGANLRVPHSERVCPETRIEPRSKYLTSSYLNKSCKHVSAELPTPIPALLLDGTQQAPYWWSSGGPSANHIPPPSRINSNADAMQATLYRKPSIPLLFQSQPPIGAGQLLII